MSRVHCLDCGISVVVDPSGLCPEGHHVGAAGARVAAALGDDRPHPDEPEPWSVFVELDEDDTVTDTAPTRRVRPIGVPDDRVEADELQSQASSDELLRELHSLTDVAPPTPAASPMELDALAELTALEAAVQALAVSHDSADEPTDHLVGPEASPRHAVELDPSATVAADELNELAELFAGPGPGDTAPSAARPAAIQPSPITTAPPHDAAPEQQEPARVGTGTIEGTNDGTNDGTIEGASEGASDGASDGTIEGTIEAAIDLGNFTASGRRVGRGSRGKRRRFGR